MKYSRGSIHSKENESSPISPSQTQPAAFISLVSTYMSMKKIVVVSLISIVTVSITACEKTVTLDLDEMESKVVIEGQVTDHPGYQFVKVSRTADFYSTGKTPGVTTATVMVEDDMGKHISFTHNPNDHPDSVGYYLPEVSFLGEINRTYKLTVVVGGQAYEARDKIYRVTSIDDLDFRINTDEQQDPEDPGRFYEVLYFVKEPKETTDYYLFKSYRNGALEYANDTDIYFADDELVGEKIEGVPMPIFYAAQDQARAEVYSLSREAFIFYRDLQKLLNNDGGMFSTPPANPRTNLSNGALGFFQTSAVSVAEIVIEE
jgi:hypothetical protein